MTAATEQVLDITHIFDAPRDLVWRAWTEPEHMMKWWGPEGFTSPTIDIDLRVGGNYLLCMRSPDGHEMWSAGTYSEIVPMERLAFSQALADEHGNHVPASHYGMSGDAPSETQIVVTFEDHEGKTKMTLTQSGMPINEMSEHAKAGWQGSFNKLARSIA